MAASLGVSDAAPPCYLAEPHHAALRRRELAIHVGSAPSARIPDSAVADAAREKYYWLAPWEKMPDPMRKFGRPTTLVPVARA